MFLMYLLRKNLNTVCAPAHSYFLFNHYGVRLPAHINGKPNASITGLYTALRSLANSSVFSRFLYGVETAGVSIRQLFSNSVHVGEPTHPESMARHE